MKVKKKNYSDCETHDIQDKNILLTKQAQNFCTNSGGGDTTGVGGRFILSTFVVLKIYNKVPVGF